MKTIAMIPARYAASRFPGKLMQDLAGKPVIVRTYQAAVATGLFDEVYVVTDSQIIYDTILWGRGQSPYEQGRTRNGKRQDCRSGNRYGRGYYCERSGR